MQQLFAIKSLTKLYKDRIVLDINHLTLEQGKITAILGPNGAGKTTLLRILNLLEPPDTGHISFLGRSISEVNRLDVARQMCMVFQRPVMFRSTVYKNVAYGLKMRGLPVKEIDRRVSESLSFVGMSDFAHSLAVNLSGGEMQRVALARALVLRPKVLLLDEPTANLDPGSVQIIEDIVKRSTEKFGTSVIIVTHNLFQAQRMADETMLLIDGQVIEKCATAKFFSAPFDTRTQGFISGTMVY